MPLKMFSGCLWLFNYRIGNLQTVCVAKPHTRHTVLNKTWLVLMFNAYTRMRLASASRASSFSVSSQPMQASVMLCP